MYGRTILRRNINMINYGALAANTRDVKLTENFSFGRERVRDVSLDISHLGVTSSHARYGVSFVCNNEQVHITKR